MYLYVERTRLQSSGQTRKWEWTDVEESKSQLEKKRRRNPVLNDPTWTLKSNISSWWGPCVPGVVFDCLHECAHTHTQIHQLETAACHPQYHSRFVTGLMLRGRAADVSVHKHRAIWNARMVAIKVRVTCAYLSTRSVIPQIHGDTRADGAPLECVM